MAPGADQVEVAFRRGATHLAERLFQIGTGLGDGLADPRDHLDRALEELVFGLRVVVVRVAFSDLGEDGGGGTHELAGRPVDEGQLHLDAEARPL